MMKESGFENTENQEQRLARLLKEKGIEDPEVRSELDHWTREQERYVEQSEDYGLEQIMFNLRRARLFFSAGYIDEALENFEAAQTQVWNEHRDELYETITKEIDEL